MIVRKILSGVLVTAALGVAPVVALPASPAAACGGVHAPATDGFPAQPTISLGSRGPAVLGLQKYLRRIDWNWSSDVTGVFGPATRAHVIAVQREGGLVPDGIVGPKTWRALGIHPSLIGGEVVLHEGDLVRPHTRAAQLLQEVAAANETLHRPSRMIGEDTTVRYTGDLVRMVQSFQSWAGIPASGIIGPKTSWAAVQVSRPTAPSC